MKTTTLALMGVGAAALAGVAFFLTRRSSSDVASTLVVGDHVLAKVDGSTASLVPVGTPPTFPAPVRLLVTGLSLPTSVIAAVDDPNASPAVQGELLNLLPVAIIAKVT